jgi:CRISPR type IV-associated protein Csf3
MTPLRVHAAVSGPIFLPDGAPRLDALLAYQVCRQEGRVCMDATQAESVDIPLQLEPEGRFHLCSEGQFTEAASELQYTIRRPVIEAMQRFAGPKLRRIRITAGANKAYRMPRAVSYLEDGITWWCIGKQQEITQLLACVRHVGKRRAAGLGVIDAWSVEPCEPWDGFPVSRGGQPLRLLPPDWPGLDNPSCGFGVLTYPYWDLSREEPCLLP